ncbi:hypothetical protein PPL_00961 [Heterostelium album PN500]|uniref:Uncharacterized protein n=1 Tax=Heterostelium pallidum (strain ATCC 26659 / Pp 5 / PN500) TaxID=670386 RepID=D3AXQ4_HETP5|nr:hypothetical protein PPL_00961 [Heterostelium album PN500]EFA85731.1 hypothetical protein PPL_00961 [Heterostelium album PN500]|eukprot:XP_020437837.1 hypothetical protein PPL_00961 [Heterostelium album PN500]
MIRNNNNINNNISTQYCSGDDQRIQYKQYSRSCNIWNLYSNRFFLPPEQRCSDIKSYGILRAVGKKKEQPVFLSNNTTIPYHSNQHKSVFHQYRLCHGKRLIWIDRDQRSTLTDPNQIDSTDSNAPMQIDSTDSNDPKQIDSTDSNTPKCMPKLVFKGDNVPIQSDMCMYLYYRMIYVLTSLSDTYREHFKIVYNESCDVNQQHKL